MSEGKKEKIKGSTAGAGSLPAGPAAAVPQFRVAAGDTRYIFATGIAKPINVGSIERAAFIVRACNAHDELVAALQAIAGFGQINLSAEWESGLRDIIRSCVDAARAALAKTEA